MKVLVVGEGPSDVGSDGGSADGTSSGGGAIGVFVQRLIGGDEPAEVLGIRWRNLARYSKRGATGFEAKVAAAMLVSKKRYGCDAVVCVADRDRETERLGAMERGRLRGESSVPGHPTVCGLAVESSEAWALGDPGALAAELGVARADIERRYPKGRSLEELYDHSGKEQYRPKRLLGELLEDAGREDGPEFRVALAKGANLKTLEQRCPSGFGAFAAEIRQQLVPVFRR